jgi:hypothetical protein
MDEISNKTAAKTLPRRSTRSNVWVNRQLQESLRGAEDLVQPMSL